MDDRRPNNRPWVILSVIGGLVVLAFVVFAVTSSARRISQALAESRPEVQNPPRTDEQNSQTNDYLEIRKIVKVYVDENDIIYVGGKKLTDWEALKPTLISMNQDPKQSMSVILRVDEDASHDSLISVKDIIDGLEIRTIIERTGSPTK